MITKWNITRTIDVGLQIAIISMVINILILLSLYSLLLSFGIMVEEDQLPLIFISSFVLGACIAIPFGDFICRFMNISKIGVLAEARKELENVEAFGTKWKELSIITKSFEIYPMDNDCIIIDSKDNGKARFIITSNDDGGFATWYYSRKIEKLVNEYGEISKL